MASPGAPRRSAPPPSGEEQGAGDTHAVVFISTNLNTHLAFDVLRSDSVAELKGKMMLTHSSLFPSNGEIRIDAVKFKYRDHFYSLSDAILVHMILGGMKNDLFLYVDVSASAEHLEVPASSPVNRDKDSNVEEGDNGRSTAIGGEERDLCDCPNGHESIVGSGVCLRSNAEGDDNARKISIVDDDLMDANSEEAAGKGASSLCPRETDDKGTSIEELPENALIASEQAVVTVVTQISGVQQHVPTQGDNNAEFIEEVPENALIHSEQAVVTVVTQISGVQQHVPTQGDNNAEFIRDEAIQGAVEAIVPEPLDTGAIGDKSSTKKRKKPGPKKESSRKKVPKEKEHVSKVASSPAKPKEPTNKEKRIGDTAIIMHEQVLEADTGNGSGVQNGLTFVQNEMIKGAQNGDVAQGQLVCSVVEAESSKKKMKKSTDKKEPSKRNAADPEGDPKEPKHLVVVGLRVTPRMEETMETHKSNKDILESASKKEVKKVTKKRRSSTLDRCSVALENTSIPASRTSFEEQDTSLSAKSGAIFSNDEGELSGLDPVRNIFTSSLASIASPSRKEGEEVRIQRRSSRRVAASQPREASRQRPAS